MKQNQSTRRNTSNMMVLLFGWILSTLLVSRHSIVYVKGFSPDPSSSSTGGGGGGQPNEGYFRFLNIIAGKNDGDDPPSGDDGDDVDERVHDEPVSIMPDYIPHFYTIGFPEIPIDPYNEDNYSAFNSKVLLKDFTIRGSLKKEILPTDNHFVKDAVNDDDDDPNICIVLESESGAQLWGAMIPSHSCLFGFFPHFFGKSRVELCIINPDKIGIGDPMDRTSIGYLSGKARCTFDYNGDALKFLKNDEHSQNQGGITVMNSMVVLPGKGIPLMGKGFMIPETRESYNLFEFHCHNMAFADCTSPPFHAVAQLSGFAHEEIECYNSLEDYEIWSKQNSVDVKRDGLGKDDFRFASQFFGNNNDREGHALIMGHVVETEIKTNEYTGDVFVWALIRTAKDMEIDIVCRKSLLESRGSPLPKVGGVIRGHFWLSGVILLNGKSEYM